VKNQLLRTLPPTDEMATPVLLQDPTPLNNGKSADAIFQACLKDWKSLRSLGHVGCAVEHYAYDRCGITAHERYWQQYHSMVKCQFDHLSPGLPIAMFHLTEFILVTPCAIHDANKSFQWAFFRRFQEKNLLRDAYICIESLRNSWKTLEACVCEWVALRLVFEDDMDIAGIEEWRGVWTCLSVEVETADLLCETLQLRFVGGRLLVARSAESIVELVSLVASTLLATWRFTRWAGSRFLSVGVSSRSMEASLLTGAGDLVDFIYSTQPSKLYYLNGFKRLTPEVRLLLVEVAVASRVSEDALASLMEGPRVVVTYHELWQTLAEEMRWVVTLPTSTWEKLASVTSATADILRADCIAASHVSMHFSWRRVLEPASRRPWSLARGDLAANLDALAAEEEDPADEVSHQLWLLARNGFPRAQLLGVLRLMQEIGWSTMTVEQQHGSVATLRRLHPEYGVETLTSRAMAMMLRRLQPKLQILLLLRCPYIFESLVAPPWRTVTLNSVSKR